MSTNINLLAEQIRKDGRERGWRVPNVHDWTTSDFMIPAQLALIHSEIVEAYAQRVSDTPDAFFAAELADIQIRTLNLAGAMTTDFAHYVDAAGEGGFAIADTEAHRFNEFHQYVTAAIEAFRRDSQVGFLSALGQLYFAVGVSAGHYYNIDLPTEIDKKMQFNRTRSIRHGGKRI